MGRTPPVPRSASERARRLDPAVPDRSMLRLRPHAASLLAVLALLGTALPTFALDVPVAGTALDLRTRRSSRTTFRFSARSEAIAAPLPDPRQGAGLLLFASGAPGQCRADLRLEPAGWRPVRGDGPRRGWRYRHPEAEPGRSLAVLIAPAGRRGGTLAVRARGRGFPCAVRAPQALPLHVAVAIAGARYCAAFDAAAVRANRSGRFTARGAPPPTACPDDDLTVANLNVLHGLFCPPATANCRLPERIALLAQWVAARGCPDVVTLQEVAAVIEAMPASLETAVNAACGGVYATAFVRTAGLDDQMILSRHRLLASKVTPLHGRFRTVLHARLDHPIGPVDVYSTHLAARSDGAGNPCDTLGPCPADCLAAGATTVRECQAVETALHVERTRIGPGPALVTGDFNDPPGSFVYRQFVARGWLDTFLVAGNAECDPQTGIGCTSGRIDDALTDLERPARNQDERIDFVFLVPPAPGSACAAVLDTPRDADGDGTGTRLFAGDPNPFAPTCGPAPAPPCWPSDHSGVEADVNCRPLADPGRNAR